MNKGFSVYRPIRRLLPNFFSDDKRMIVDSKEDLRRLLPGLDYDFTGLKEWVKSINEKGYVVIG